MQLEQWGANLNYEQIAAEYPDYLIGRVVSQEKDLYRLMTEKGTCYARVSGKYRYEVTSVSDFPAVGDFVLAEYLSEEEVAVIHKLLPRKSVFIRKAAGTGYEEQVVAANIDIVFICMSLNRDFNIRRLERYLAIAWDSGAMPVVVLTKTDLCENPESKKFEIEMAAAGAAVIETSALTEDGISQIEPYLQTGKTVAFIGSSGAGKSTLINRILGEERIATNGLRNDDKGRHTATHRELFFVSDKGMVIDTPGMRELGMWNAEEGIERTFTDIEELAGKCRFHDCTHRSEPGCAVQKAIKEGTIPEERFLAYQKLKAENAYAEDARSYLDAKKRKFKEIAKYNKNNRKK